MWSLYLTCIARFFCFRGENSRTLQSSGAFYLRLEILVKKRAILKSTLCTKANGAVNTAGASEECIFVQFRIVQAFTRKTNKKKNICGISMISTTEDKVKLPFQI